MKAKKIYHIVIEGSDAEQMQDLFEEVQNRYKLFDNCVLEDSVSPANSIIDYEENRYKETGGLKVLPKAVVMKAKKEANEKCLFTTNLKGYNLIEVNETSVMVSDEDCASLVEQIVDKLGVEGVARV